MPCCAAYGCSVQHGRGKRLHYFPRDPLRRKIWAQKVRRIKWKPNNFSLLCEDHFDETQFESHRADGVRKLKPNAIPTLFVFTPPAPPSRPTKPKQTEDGPSLGERCRHDHPYADTTIPCPTPLEDQSDSQVDDNLTDDPCNGGSVSDEAASGKTASGDPPARDSSSCQITAYENLVKALRKEVCSLQRKLAEERKLKLSVIRQNKRIARNLASIFNPHQVLKLSQSSLRGTKWSADTIKEGLQVKFACGSTGYNLLLSQNHPLPSERKSTSCHGIKSPQP